MGKQTLYLNEWSRHLLSLLAAHTHRNLRTSLVCYPRLLPYPLHISITHCCFQVVRKRAGCVTWLFGTLRLAATLSSNDSKTRYLGLLFASLRWSSQATERRQEDKMQTLDDSLSARAWFGCLIFAHARSRARPSRHRPPPSPSATFVDRGGRKQDGKTLSRR